jgi:hypothetical protein
LLRPDRCFGARILRKMSLCKIGYYGKILADLPGSAVGGGLPLPHLTEKRGEARW